MILLGDLHALGYIESISSNWLMHRYQILEDMIVFRRRNGTVQHVVGIQDESTAYRKIHLHDVVHIDKKQYIVDLGSIPVVPLRQHVSEE